MTSHLEKHVDFYAVATSLFNDMVSRLRETAACNHADVERAVLEGGTAILRNLFQGWLDQVAALEKFLSKSFPKPQGVDEVRQWSCQMECTFGRVYPRRLGYKKQGEPSVFPLDEALNLPAKLYSLPLSERVADEARRSSFGEVVATVDKTTGAHVPRRQAEELTREVAQDFDDFYEQKSSSDTVSPDALELMSSDCKGVRMIEKGLRNQTQKAKQKEEESRVRGDPMAQRKASRHDKRMAVATANWEQTPKVRTAEDIMSGFDGEDKEKKQRAKLPPPQNKRVRASVEKSLAEGVEEMFEELERRDPRHERKVGVLLDGDEDQLKLVKQEANKRGISSIRVILDVIHVLHYLWMATYALCNKDDRKTEAFTRELLRRMLTGPANYVASTLRRMATMQQLGDKAREPVDTCCDYLLKYQEHMRYSEYLAQGFPIASGIIEGTCRYLIQDRLGITGARWDVPGAEAVLRLRAIRSSGDWDEYIAFHERQELSRNHQARKADLPPGKRSYTRGQAKSLRPN